MTYTETVEHTN